MIRNYLKIAWRNLIKSKGYSALNIGGYWSPYGSRIGDGKADVAVYREGTWWIYQSTLGVTGVLWGVTSDVPVPRK